MRRFVLFAVLCALSLPVGLSVTGCNPNNGAKYCSGFQTGPLVTATATITLQPSTYGISVNYGQIYPVATPSAFTCKGTSSGLTTFTFGTTNLQLADVSPTGTVCGGTWNRSSPNGVADFTTCTPTNQSGVAYITASGGGATSNPVPVFVHPPVTSVVLAGSGSTAPGCVSQNRTSQLTGTVYSGTTDITADAGHLVYAAQNPNIVTIQQNGVATALQPGATVVSATVAQATSTAGYFFTCPPASIQLRVGTTNQTSVNVNPNNIQPLTTTVLDTQNNPITGLALTYTSNDPINIPVGAKTGSVAPVYPSDAAITAQCLPAICNPAPQDQIGNLSTGLPITSNPVQVHTPGPSSDILYMSSPDSYNFVPVDFQSGTVGTPVRLPYQPNSMVMDESGNFLYFGSATEAMIVSISATGGSALTTQVPAIPGTVLAVSPDDSVVVVHDPCRQLFYLYTPAVAGTPTTGTTGTGTTTGGTAASLLAFGAPGPTIACNSNSQPLDPSVEVNPPYSAAFTQDSQTLYIVNGNVLYTYSKFTGWHTCTDNGQTGNCPIDSTGVAVTIPGVAAFAAGPTTTAFGYCAIGPNNSGAQTAGPPPTGVNPNTASNPTAYYPLADTVPAATDQLAATTDGYHVIGATAAGELTDIQPAIPAGSCPLNKPLTFTSTFTQASLATPNIQSIDQVLVSPNSQLAFVTFTPTSSTGSNNTLPAYQIPCTTAQGTCPTGQATTGKVVNIPLTGQAGAPIGGTFSPDTTEFYVSTSTDDLVHFISTSSINSLVDTQQINPGLTCGTTTTAPANPFLACTLNQPVPALFLAARPRPSQGTATSTLRKD